MTFAEMRSRAEILYESIDSANAPGFTDGEWGEILSQAQYKVVNDILKDGVAKNAFNRRAIDAIILTQEFTDTDAGVSIAAHATITNGYTVNIENTALAGISTEDQIWWVLPTVMADALVGTTTYTDIDVDEISYGEYHASRNNPFKKPDYEEKFWYFPENSELVVITDGSTLKKVRIQYIESLEGHPIALASDCILDESIHPRIVEKAVGIAHSAVQDQVGFQLQTIENLNPTLP